MISRNSHTNRSPIPSGYTRISPSSRHWSRLPRNEKKHLPITASINRLISLFSQIYSRFLRLQPPPPWEDPFHSFSARSDPTSVSLFFHLPIRNHRQNENVFNVSIHPGGRRSCIRSDPAFREGWSSFVVLVITRFITVIISIIVVVFFLGKPIPVGRSVECAKTINQYCFCDSGERAGAAQWDAPSWLQTREDPYGWAPEWWYDVTEYDDDDVTIHRWIGLRRRCHRWYRKWNRCHTPWTTCDGSR